MTELDEPGSSPKQKILFSVSGYPPSRGGAEALCHRYARELAARDHDVEVIVPDLLHSNDFYSLDARLVSDASAIRESEPNVRRIPFLNKHESRAARMFVGCMPTQGAKSFSIKGILWLSAHRFRWRIRQAIIASRPDVVVTAVHLHPNVEASLIAARLIGATSVYMPLLHEQDPNWPHEGVKRCVAMADAILALTDGEATSLVRDYGADTDCVFVTGVGVDVPRSSVQSRPDVPTILFLGRKTASKGLDLLARALEIVVRQGSEFRFSFTGASAEDSPTYEEVFRNILGERFVSISDASDDEKKVQLHSCSLLVLPSTTESFGLVLLEAWAFERPVVAIDFPVAREIVEDGVDGILVSNEDPDALADAMITLINSPALAGRMGVAGKQKVDRAYSWNGRIDALERACVTPRKY